MNQQGQLGDPAPRTALIAHPSAELYGSDRVMLESVEGLLAAGWRVIVTVPQSGPLVAEIEKRHAELVICPAPVLRKSALQPRGFLRLLAELTRSWLPGRRIILGENCDVVYVSTLTIPFWVILSRLCRVPVVCHVHEAEGSASKFLRWAMAAPLLAADRIVLNSEFSLQVLTSSVGRLKRRCTVIYNGIGGPQAVTPARDTLEEPVRMLFLGRLSPRKGAKIAIESAAELVRRGMNVQLSFLGSVFAGYEWFEAELGELVRTSHLDAHVTFLGFQADVWPELSKADVVLVPSVSDEPFGNTAVEAVLAARPLIASATTGLKEAAQGYRSAQLVAPADPGAIADAVARLYRNWDCFRQAALDDSVEASRRHSPIAYQAAIAELLLDASGVERR